MRRSWFIATLGLILAASFLSGRGFGQDHGGGGSHSSFSGHSFSGHSSAGHSSFSGHSSYTPSSAGHAGIGSSFRSANVGRSYGGHSRGGSHSDSQRGYYGHRAPYYPYGYYYPYYPYYGWYTDPLDSSYGSSYDGSQDQDAYASAPYADSGNPSSVSNSDDSSLRGDVHALNGKLDRLQADSETRNHKPQQEPVTALVFRNGNVEEVRNYAIAGGTLWVFNDRSSKKIPLAQLDLPATAKMNDERGVDFQLPQPALSIMIMN